MNRIIIIKTCYRCLFRSNRWFVIDYDPAGNTSDYIPHCDRHSRDFKRGEMKRIPAWCGLKKEKIK